MFVYLSGVLIGFLTGFVSGYSFNFMWNVYNRYKISKNTQKALAQEIFTLYSSKLFDMVYGELESGKIKMPDANELFIVSHDIIELSKDYNKKFKVIMKKGVPIIKILDDKYLKDERVIKVLGFLTKNDIELTLSTSTSHNQVFEIEEK
jgi:hypothetical protein